MQVRYSRSDIAEWKGKLESLPKEIEILEKTIAENKVILGADKNQLNELETKINAEKALLKQIIAKIDLLTLPEQISLLKSKLSPLESQIENLREPIIHTERAIEPLKNEIQQIESWISIKEIQANIQELDQKIISLVGARNISEGDLRNAQRELDDLTHAYNQICSELLNLNEKKESINREINELKRARDDAEEDARRNYSSSMSGGYSSSASSGNQGFTSSVRHADSSGFESSVSTHVVMSSQTEHLIAEYNGKIQAKEHEQDMLGEQIRNRKSDQSRARSRRDEVLIRINNIERNISVYSRDIRSAEDSRGTLKSKLSHYGYQDKEQASAHTFASLREKLKDQENILRPIQNKLDSLTGERDSLRRAHESLMDDILRLENRVRECEVIASTFSSNENIEQLNKSRAGQDALLNELADKKTSLERKINQGERDYESNNGKIKVLSRELKDKRSNQYLHNMENSPVDLLNKLALSVYQGIQLFDLQHSFHQSVTVRKCLAELSYKLNYILPQHRLPLNVKECDPVLARQQYYLICGLLQDELTHLDKQTDGELQQLINNLLRDHLISLSEARLEYCDFENQHPLELPAMTDAFLLQVEMQAFENARRDFQASIERLKLSNSPELKKVRMLGDDLLDRIDNKKRESLKSRSTPFDNKYYSTLLTYGNKLLITKPDDPNYVVYRQTFQQLASEHPNDRPSVWNKIGGVALMFLGAAIVAAGALAMVFSFPFAPPLSYYIAAPVCAAGVGILLGGVGLFRRGCHAGMPEKLGAFSSNTEKVGSQLWDNRDAASDSLLGPGSYGDNYQVASKAL